MPTDISTAILAVGIMALGSAFQAAVGIGLALYVVPLLVIIDANYVPGPMLLAGSVLAIMTAWRERSAIELSGLARSVVGLAVGTALGAMLIKVFSGPDLPKIFGFFVLFAVLLSVVGPPIRATRISLPLAGTVSGVMGTMVGIHGPPIALVFQNTEPAAARAMLSAFFALAYLGSVAALFFVGSFGQSELLRAMVLLPGVGIGLVAAPYIAPFIDRLRLRWAILVVSTISALVLLTR